MIALPRLTLLSARGTIPRMMQPMTMRATRALTVVALLLSACAEGTAGEPGGLQLTTAALAHEGCALDNGDGVFPIGPDGEAVDRVVVEISGGEIPAAEPVVAALVAGDLNAAGAGVVDGIPEGADMTVDVVGCDEGEAVWSGTTRGVDVEAGRETNVDVFLTMKDAVGCVGVGGVATLDDPHAFGAAWGDGERVWIGGGFDAWTAVDLTLHATAGVHRYSRVKSSFVELGTALSSPRAMALVQPLEGGAVRLVGGTTALTLAGSPPLAVGAAAQPSAAVELYDPAGMGAGIGDAIAALPAVVALADGSALAAGGASAAGAPVALGWRVPPGEITAADIETFALAEARYGATLLASGEEPAALLWGGLAAYDPDAVAAWVDVSGAIAAVTPLAGQAETGVPVFAAGAWLGSSADGHPVFAIVGGSEIEADGYTLVPAAPRLERVTVDVGAGTFTAESLGGSDTAWQRALPTLVRLDSGALWVLGGFTSFSNHEVCDGAAPCFPGGMPRIALEPSGALASAGVELDLPVGGFGAVPARTGDGSWLVVGGLAGLSGTGVGDVLERDAALVRFDIARADLCSQ